MEMGEDSNKNSIIEFSVRERHIVRFMVDLDKCQTKEEARQKIRNMLIKIDEYLDGQYEHEVDPIMTAKG